MGLAALKDSDSGVGIAVVVVAGCGSFAVVLVGSADRFACAIALSASRIVRNCNGPAAVGGKDVVQLLLDRKSKLSLPKPA